MRWRAGCRAKSCLSLTSSVSLALSADRHRHQQRPGSHLREMSPSLPLSLGGGVGFPLGCRTGRRRARGTVESGNCSRLSARRTRWTDHSGARGSPRHGRLPVPPVFVGRPVGAVPSRAEQGAYRPPLTPRGAVPEVPCTPPTGASVS